MGKTLVVKENAISDYKYDGQDIENLILEEGILYIGRGAFRRNNIKKLYLPKSIKKIDAGAFHLNPLTEVIFYNNGAEFCSFCFGGNIKKITIIDCDYKFLFILFKRVTSGQYKFDHFLGIKEINIVNDKLNLIEKLKIKYISSKYSKININVLQNINLDEFINHETNTENIDNEVNELLSKIYSMIELLDNKSKQVIIDKIESLINEYQTKLEKSKPQFNMDNNSSLTIEDTSPKALRNNLIFSLEMIIQNLNTKGKIINLSEKINQYQQFLLGKEINIENDETFLKIKDIINLSKSIGETKYIDKLSELFEKIKKSILENLDDEYVINLTLKKYDIETYFKEELNNIYNEVIGLNDKLKPYLNLLKALEEHENGISLSKELRELEDIFSELIGKSKDELNSEYQKLKESYIDILKENILKLKENEFDGLSSDEIELNFRKELHSILERLNKIVPFNSKNKKIYNQLFNGAKVINGKEIAEKGSIIELIKEINQLLGNNILDSTIKEIVSNKIIFILCYWNGILSNRNTSEIVKNLSSEIGLTSENLILEVMILKQLYELKFSVERYIVDSQEYDMVISSAGTISVDKSKSEIESLKELKARIQDDRPSNISKKYLKEYNKCLDLISSENDSSEYKKIMKYLTDIY